MIIYHSKEQRDPHVRKRDGGQCNHCGNVGMKWEVDTSNLCGNRR